MLKLDTSLDSNAMLRDETVPILIIPNNILISVSVYQIFYQFCVVKCLRFILNFSLLLYLSLNFNKAFVQLKGNFCHQ